MKSRTSHIDGSSFFLFLHYESLEDSLKRELDNFIDRLIMSLSNENFGKDERAFDDLFRLRIKALQWIAEKQMNIADLVDEAYPFIEEIAKDKSLNSVGRNILFAMESQAAVAQHIFSGNSPVGAFDLDQLTNALPTLQTVSYQQLKLLTSLAAPNEESFRFMSWLESSLNLEYFIFVAAIVKERKIRLVTDRIESLAKLILTSANDFNGFAIQLGMLPIQPNTTLLKDFTFKVLHVNNHDYKFDRDEANER